MTSIKSYVDLQAQRLNHTISDNLSGLIFARESDLRAPEREKISFHTLRTKKVWPGQLVYKDEVAKLSGKIHFYSRRVKGRKDLCQKVLIRRRQLRI